MSLTDCVGHQHGLRRLGKCVVEENDRVIESNIEGG